jgi:hypothetical protein
VGGHLRKVGGSVDDAVKQLHFWLVFKQNEIIREFKGSGKFPIVPKGGDFVYWGVQHKVEKVVWSFPDREDHSLIRADVLLA